MNYSTFPNEDQSGIPKINLLYNEKKNNRVKPSMPYLKKRNDSTKKVNFTNKESERTMEHFSNPRSKKKKKTSDKENFISPQNLENENTTSVDSSKDSDSNSVDDNDTSIEEVTEKVPEEIEKKKSKSLLSRIISGVLTLVFFIVIGAIIYVGYMYFIKKKNIFANEENIISESLPTNDVLEGTQPKNILKSPEALKLPVKENIPSISNIVENTNVSPLITNDSLEGENEMIGQDTEMTGGQMGMVSDIINILKKFQN